MSSITQRFILRHGQIPEGLSIGDLFNLSTAESELYHQIIVVYRCKVGDQAILMNLNRINPSNTAYHCEIVACSKKLITMKLIKIDQINENKQSLTLALCLPNKPAKLDFIIEKAVELGIWNLILIKSDYSNFSHQLRLDRLEKILIEAAEQSERAITPTIFEYKNVDQYLESQPVNLMVALERSSSEQNLIKLNLLAQNYSVLIGPEGGFSDREKSLFTAKKLTIINLGDQILKQDTAALLAVAILKFKQA